MAHIWRYYVYDGTKPNFTDRAKTADFGRVDTVSLNMPDGDDWDAIRTCITDAVHAEFLENRRPEIILLGGLWYAAWQKYTGCTEYEGCAVRPCHVRDEGVIVLCRPDQEFNKYLKGKL